MLLLRNVRDTSSFRSLNLRLILNLNGMFKAGSFLYRFLNLVLNDNDSGNSCFVRLTIEAIYKDNVWGV